MAHQGKLLIITVLAWYLVGCGPTNTQRLQLPPLETVLEVDVERYMGSWYEIAAFPQRFQKGCTGTTASYTLRPDDEVDVVNRCFLDSLEGEEKIAEGRARVVDEVSNARLEVSFFRPFWGDYWIIELDDNYQYAVVGHPSREYLWLLSRTPHMEDAVYEEILTRLREVHLYPLEQLEKTVQPAI